MGADSVGRPTQKMRATVALTCPVSAHTPRLTLPCTPLPSVDRTWYVFLSVLTVRRGSWGGVRARIAGQSAQPVALWLNLHPPKRQPPPSDPTPCATPRTQRMNPHTTLRLQRRRKGGCESRAPVTPAPQHHRTAPPTTHHSAHARARHSRGMLSVHFPDDEFSRGKQTVATAIQPSKIVKGGSVAPPGGSVRGVSVRKSQEACWGLHGGQCCGRWALTLLGRFATSRPLPTPPTWHAHGAAVMLLLFTHGWRAGTRGD